LSTRKINPETIVAHEKIKNLSEIQATSTETVARTIQDTADSTRAQIAAISIQGSESTSRLTQGLEQVLELQTTSRKATSALHAKLDDLSSCNSSSTTSILTVSGNETRKQLKLFEFTLSKDGHNLPVSIENLIRSMLQLKQSEVPWIILQTPRAIQAS